MGKVYRRPTAPTTTPGTPAGLTMQEKHQALVTMSRQGRSPGTAAPIRKPVAIEPEPVFCDTHLGRN